jgi:mRNA-decapping enzyme subunit 2
MEQENRRSPQFNYAAAQAASLPYGQQSPSSTHSVPSSQQHQQPPNVLQRRKDSNPDQKQKLLSLFSKEQQQYQQSSPTGFSAATEETTTYKGKEPAVAAFDQHQPTRSGSTPRSRVASFASTVGGGPEQPPPTGSSRATSRRGSQTPISPADRNFLLSYLDSVTNTSR